MKKLVIIVVVVAALAGVAVYSGVFTRESAQAADEQTAAQDAAGRGGRQGGGGGGRGGRFGGGGPLTVEVAHASRGSVIQHLIVVGNLIGDATVAVVPRAAGRLEGVFVQLGDRVTRGQRIAKIEDEELREQIKQAEAAQEVSRATIRQREADLKLAETNVERSRSLFERQLLPKQTLDDNEARYQSAVAALDLARAQSSQSQARLDELQVNMANTVITSPVNGFVARRAADPGAFVSQNAPVADVVDISRVRLVVNVVEKDLKQVQVGDMAEVSVDAFPGEKFSGRIARVAPVLDPATRTAPIEIEIPNPVFRLKPGMYARVGIKTEERPNALVVPTNAVVAVGGERGVFLALNDNTAAFRRVQVGVESDDRIEILDGVAEGDRVVTTGAAALRDGDRFLLTGDGESGQSRGEGGQRGRTGGGQATPGNRQGVAGASGFAARGAREDFGGAQGFRGGEATQGTNGSQGTGEFGGRRGGGRRGGQPSQGN
jgi:HlyD family secretion protein